MQAQNDSVPYIDLHCDALMKACVKLKKDMAKPGGHISLNALQRGLCKAQFFAIFMPPIIAKRFLGPLFPKDEAYIQRCLNIFQTTLERYPNVIAMAKTAADIEANWKGGKISGILTLEDGRAVAGKLENLERFYNQGIRLISLTWNQENCFGAPNSSKPEIMNRGLSEFGKDAVRYMNEVGMIVDVSHLSDGGFWDVAKISNRPFVASHSNCRSINPHSRSLTDDMIRTLADKGGVMGVNFGPEFLTEDKNNRFSKTEFIVRQLQHMVQRGGEDCAAIGTDFDGISGKLEISTPQDMPLLFDALGRAGFTSAQIEKIAWRNAQRAISEAL